MKNSPSIFYNYLWMLAVALLVSSFVLPARYKMPYPQKPASQFQFRPAVKPNNLQAISEKQPEVVLIGDSVLEWGVDEEALSNRLGMVTYKIGVAGSASAVWYLALKNTVAEAPVLPRYVVILFNDTILTIPSYRTTGSYFLMLDDYARGREPLVTQLSFINAMNPVERGAEKYLPLYGARWKLRAELDFSLRYTGTTVLLNCPKTCVDESINSTFGRQTLDAMAINQAVFNSHIYTRENLDFDGRVEQSFLPAMIYIAQENNMTLVFVRMKNLKFPEYASETPAFRAYIKSLSEYLSKQDHVQFIDIAHDERIKNEYFVDGLHLTDEGKIAFSQILADELKTVLK